MLVISMGTQRAPDVMLETQIAVQAASVISSHFQRPRGEQLDRIVDQIREFVITAYKSAGIECD